MARSLLNVPLPVLREQLVDIQSFLRIEVWANALRDVNIDPVELAEAAARAVESGGQAMVAVRLARAELTRARKERRRWCADFATWADGLRMKLRILKHASPREATELRRRLGVRPGRYFAPSRDTLDLTLSGLRAFGDALGPLPWYGEVTREGQHLLDRAAEVSDAVAVAERELGDRSRDVVRVRRDLQQLARRVRDAWAIACHRRHDLPELPLDVLVAYTSRRAEPAPIAQKGESALRQDESEPRQGESAPRQRESRPRQGESAPRQSESEPRQSESALRQRESWGGK